MYTVTIVYPQLGIKDTIEVEDNPIIGDEKEEKE